MKLFRIWLCVSAVVALSTGCGLETGSGDLVFEVREVATFDRVAVSDGIRVVLMVTADAAHSVSVRYDDNLLDALLTRVDGTTLVIEFDGNVNVGGGSSRAVEVVLPRLKSIEASGGAFVKASGRVQGYTIDVSGGATIAAAELEAREVDVDASGGAVVRVFARSSVTGDASGGASIKVKGSPPSVEVDTSGGATVES